MNQTLFRLVVFAGLSLSLFPGVVRGAGDSAKNSVTVYVSATGSDEWSGSLERPDSNLKDGPLATLERARDVVRELRASGTPAVEVVVDEGVYELTDPLKLSEQDGGASPETPVVWRAKEGSSVMLCAGRFLTGAVDSLSDDLYPDRIAAELRERLRVVDLKGQDVGDFGAPGVAPALFFQGRPMQIARYPNDQFVKITGLIQEGTTEVDVRGTKGIVEGVFQFDDDEILRCASEDALWACGYWFWDWSEQRSRVASIDVASKTMTLEPPYHVYGYRKGQWFYVYNALCELDAPGEYFIDAATEKLFFYPPTDECQSADFLLTRLPHVLELDNVSNLVFSGFQMCGSRQDAVSGTGLNHVTLRECDVFNIGGSGIVLSGFDLLVTECELWHAGRAGIRVSGGYRETLEPGRNVVSENYIHDYALVNRVYEPGVSVNGVGNLVAHNLIENAPHMAIGFGGNDHVIEFNEIGNVCFESNDAGAIYTGRNWTMRGHILRGNYLHDITGFQNNGCVGIYLDDMFSSAEISGNLFVNVTRAAFIGGGQYSSITGNLFVNCLPALHIDARGAGWSRDRVDEWIAEGKEKGTLNGVKYREEPYLSRYPELATILDDEDRAHYPAGCSVTENVCVGGFWDVNKHGQWQGETIEAAARDYLKIEKNLVLEEDDGSVFVDSGHGDYRFKPDSEPSKAGFESLPISQMGLSSERMKTKAAHWRLKN